MQSLPFLPGAEEQIGGAKGSKVVTFRRVGTDTSAHQSPVTRKLSSALSLPHLSRREDALSTSQRIWGASQHVGAAKLPYLRPDQLEAEKAGPDDGKFRTSRTGSFLNLQGGKQHAGASRRKLLSGQEPLSPGRRNALLDRARCSKGFVRPACPRSIGVLDRKASQQAALDRDKKYVQQQLLLQAQDQEPSTPQEDATNGRWWNTTFAPIPDPRRYLPHVYEALIATPRVCSHELQCVTPATPSPAAPARPPGENPVFSVEELEEAIRVCGLFQALVAPKSPEVAPGDATTATLGLPVGPVVLQRSSFCRLVCAMEGLAIGPGEPAQLGRAVAHFDELASRFVVRNSSSPGGAVVGFLLSSGIPGQPQQHLHDLPLSALFTRLLMDMAADLGSGVPERPNTGEGLAALSTAKTRLMEVLLPQAAHYAEDRAKLVQRYNRDRKLRRVITASSRSLEGSKTHSEAPNAIDEGAEERPGSKSSLPSSKEPPTEACQTCRSSTGFLGKARRPSALSASASLHRASVVDTGGGDNSGGLSSSQALVLSFADHESLSVHSSPREVSEPDEDEDPWQLQEWEDEAYACTPEREEEDQAAKSIYRHTFAVLKGELLSSQLLEPEVMHFIAQFSDIFRKFFDAYADVPVSATEGHMTLTAFLRFCNDFSLFPDMVDFQTIQWLYHTAEGCGYVQQPPQAPATARTPTAEDSPPLRREPSRRVSVEGKDSVPTSPSPHRVSSMSSPDPTRRGSILREPSAALKKKRLAMKQQQQQDDGILYGGKWLKSNLAWLIKDPAAMSVEEATITAVLWAMDEWLQDMRMQVSEVCSFLTPPGSNTVSAEDLCIILDFMRFEDGPSHEDVHRLAEALAAQPTPQENPMVEISLLQMAMTAVGKVKERRNRAANCFMKDFSKMTKAESNALVFFRELWYTIEYKNITPEDLFRDFDADRNGTISPEELTTQIHQILKFMPSPSAALTVEGPFDMLDVDSDGRISKEEFVSVMNKVKQAREARKMQEEEKHPIFLSAKASRSTSQRRTFFCHRAFAECLVKVALHHLGYHCSPAQAEQPSFVKALWLLLYLHWKFECAVDRISMTMLRIERHPTSALAGRLRPVHQSPMKRLVSYHEEIFENAPEKPPPEDLCPAWSPSRDPCSVCHTTAVRGWGKPTCPHCSQADAVLAACWSRGRPTARGQRSLDGMLLAVETDG